jgi:small subunit ribosomal protein S6
MNKYELTVIVRNEGDIEVVKKLLESYEGKIIEEKKWGKRELAYPIKKETSAFYFTYQLEVGGSNISDFKKKLNFDDKVLRYLMLKRS